MEDHARELQLHSSHEEGNYAQQDEDVDCPITTPAGTLCQKAVCKSESHEQDGRCHTKPPCKAPGKLLGDLRPTMPRVLILPPLRRCCVHVRPGDWDESCHATPIVEELGGQLVHEGFGNL